VPARSLILTAGLEAFRTDAWPVAKIVADDRGPDGGALRLL
jgi:hypothetical protein